MPRPIGPSTDGVVMVRLEDMRPAGKAARANSGRPAARYFLRNRTRSRTASAGRPVLVDTGERGEYAGEPHVHLRIDPAA